MPASSMPKPNAQNVVPSRGVSHSTTTVATIARTVNPSGETRAGAEGRTRVTGQVQPEQVPEHVDATAPGEPVDCEHLGADVDQNATTAVDAKTRRIRAGRAGGLVGGSPEFSDVPRAACMTGTVWHGGKP